MKINELIWFKAIYPRNRDQFNDNEVKIDDENVEKIKDYIALNKKLPQKITYNKRTMHIIDGTHTWIAASELGWKDIPKSDLEEIDIPLEQEMWEAAKLNSAHGKQLSRKELQAVFWQYCDRERYRENKEERMKYGTLKGFSKDFTIPIGTLRNWLQTERGNITREDSTDQSNSSGNEGQEDKEKEKLKGEVEELRMELTKVKADARTAFWEMICESHQEAIKGCKKCGK